MGKSSADPQRREPNERRERHVKWSVTVPARIAEVVEAEVLEGRAPSVSAVVARALDRELLQEEDDLDKLIRHWVETGQVVITDKERAWARRVLDL